MLDEQHRDAAPVADRLDLAAEILHFLVVEARRRLVEQQQFGFDGERAGEFDPLARAERQFADRTMCDLREPKFFDQRVCALGDPLLLATRERQRKAVDQEAAARERMDADHHVLAHAHGRKQREILERARDAELRDRVPGHGFELDAVEDGSSRTAARRGGRCS